MAADIFGTAETSSENALSTLVGEGKKFQTVEALANSKIEADRFIETLKTERAAEAAEVLRLKAELETRKSVEEQLKALKTSAPEIKSPDPAAPAQGTVLTEDDLNKRILAVTESKRQEEVTRGNVQAVADGLVQAFGTEEKAREVVAAKAKELGVSTQFLQSVAASSPAAFFATIGVTAPKPSTSAVTRSDVNTDAFRRDTVTHASGTYEAMKADRANDAKKLLDPNYLAAALEAGLKDPEKFYGDRFKNL
jgi:hypothetical protein